jgi:hypothetical protein
MHRRFVPRLIALALFVLPAISHAAPTEGERLFREGRAAMQDKDYDTACARFAESQRKEPAPGTSLNLGECEERRVHLIAARDAFTSAAAAFATAEKKGYASGRAEALDKRIPRVVVRVSGAPRGVVVRAGDRVVEPGVELRFDPGEVVFTVEATAFHTKKVPATLKESPAIVEIDLGPLEADRPPVAAVVAKPKPEQPVAPPAARSGSNGMRTLGWTLGGVGLASLVVGGITGVMTLDRASTVKEHCDGDLACDPEGKSAASSGETLSLISTITVIGGVLGMGAGGLLLLTSPSRKAPGSSTSTARTTIRQGPGGLGLMLERSF